MKLVRSQLPPITFGQNQKRRSSTSFFRWKMFGYVLLFSLATNFHITFASHTSGNLIPKLIHAIEKAAAFFQDNYEDVNVDGLFGLQVGQGQLKESASWLNLTNLKWKKPVQRVVDQMSQVLDKTLENNLANDITYTKQFLELLKSPFYFQWQPQQVDFSFTPKSFYKVTYYDEEKGDACFARVLGSYVENNRTFPQCTVTKDCLVYMTAPYAAGYYLTHQLLYFIFIQRIGCEGSDVLRRFAERPTVRDIQRNFCRRIYQESKQLAENGKVIGNQDLFAEQTILCAPLGYLDFFRADWMKMLISWQDPSGCFANNPPSETSEIKHSSSTMRKLLREQYMQGGCLSHKSGLCYGALTAYLNFLIQHTGYKK